MSPPSEREIIAAERQALMLMLADLPLRSIDENVLIATWNIAQFTNNKTDRALQYIADICERFDIIAIQEVKTDLRGLAKLQLLLPGHYKILVSDPTGNSERMAYLYDERSVTATGLVYEVAFHGTIGDPEVFQLNRTPYCASFRAGRFDFVLVSVHIVEGSDYGEVGDDRREEEITKLVEFVKKAARRDQGKVFDPDFILVGDFNIQDTGDRFWRALTNGSRSRRKFEMPPAMDDLKTNFSQTRGYDKIAWLPTEDFEFASFGTIPFGDVVYKESGQSPNEARRRVSDHLPLWAEFRVTELESHLNGILGLD